MIVACDHDDAERSVGICDCGAEVDACLNCLAEDRVRACGHCERDEATNDRDESLRWARKAAKLRLERVDYAELLADSWEEERLIAYLKAENRRLEAKKERLLAENQRVRRQLDESEGPSAPHWLLEDDGPAVGVAAPIHGEGKIGRNDPCPCGSGKKYKKCCRNLER